MANLFKRAALAFGRWTGITRKPVAAEQAFPQVADGDGRALDSAEADRHDSDLDAVLFSAYLAESGATDGPDALVEAPVAIEVEATADVAVIDEVSTVSMADADEVTAEASGEYMMQFEEPEVTAGADLPATELEIAAVETSTVEVSGELPSLELATEVAEVSTAEVVVATLADDNFPFEELSAARVENEIAAAELPATDVVAESTAPDAPVTAWGEALESTATPALSMPFDPEAAVAAQLIPLAPLDASQASEQASTYTLIADPEQAVSFQPLSFGAESTLIESPVVEAPVAELPLIAAVEVAAPVAAAEQNLIESLIFPAPEHMDVAPADVAPVIKTPEPAPAAAIDEDVNVPVEMKPLPKAGVSFTKLYKLISSEAGKRTDDTVAAYERLLNSTRHELEATRKGGRLAWSVGGVMTAVAAFGAIYSAGEMSAARVEVAALKQQVTANQQITIERDQLRSDLNKTREISARVEIDALKARLDQALTVSSDRDRLRGELEVARKAKQEAESELRVTRSGAATQPVSQAQPAGGKMFGDRSAADRVAGSERPDVWSVLLNGGEKR